MAIRVGYHGITWGGDGFLRAIDDISSLGYEGIETFPNVYSWFANHTGLLKKLLRERGLKLVTLYCGGSLIYKEKAKEEIRWNVEVARFLKKMGSNILIMGGGERREGANLKEDIRQMARTLDEIAKRCAEFGVKACYHPHLWTRVERREEIAMLMDMTRHLYLAPDTAHLYRGGSDPVEVFSTYIDRIAYCHFKDSNPRAEAKRKGGATEALPIFSELGTGPVDFPGIMEILRKNRYNGWIMIELDQSTTTPKESARKSRDYMNKVLGFNIRPRR